MQTTITYCANLAVAYFFGEIKWLQRKLKYYLINCNLFRLKNNESIKSDNILTQTKIMYIFVSRISDLLWIRLTNFVCKCKELVQSIFIFLHRRTGVMRSAGPNRHDHGQHRHNPMKHKRKPPRGMFIIAEDLSLFTSGPPAQADAVLKNAEADLVSLKRQVSWFMKLIL